MDTTAGPAQAGSGAKRKKYFKVSQSKASCNLAVLKTRLQIAWLVHACIGTIFYGFLHHGGTLPALAALERHLSQLPHGTLPSRITFWKIFSPPRHLFMPTGSTVEAEVEIMDPPGRTTCEEYLTEVQSYNGSQYLVFPQHHINHEMDIYLRENYQLLNNKAYGFHLDPDHMSELLKG